MLEQVRKTIIEHRMLGHGQVAGVAVSGGADSVCLLHILRELAPELGIRLHVVHLDHRLRGEESAGDARFVTELAGSMGLPVTVEGADPGSESGNLEQAAREARRSFFTRLRLDGRVDRIATGHTLSDQAETVLYRILRGSGTAGLSGVLPVTPDEIVRPLLDCSRHQVEQYLRERCISWREDRTNMDPAFARNRIRHVLIPLLEREFSPSVTSILASTASLAQSEENYWSERVSEIFSDLVKNKFKSVLIRADKLSRLHPALARRLVRRAIVEAKGNMRSIDLVHVERIRDL
ncbi:MAG: tRNA lysidine(34) synthetase TilS, partial [Bryobacteraceae bacterium]|nr:tRNA lysidine(34) synthetase TilS [Bryobacteraceae bacterium]